MGQPADKEEQRQDSSAIDSAGNALGDPLKKGEAREKAAAAMKTFTRVSKCSDTGLLDVIGETLTEKGWDGLLVGTSPQGIFGGRSRCPKQREGSQEGGAQAGGRRV